jgi:hypothetical protein
MVPVNASFRSATWNFKKRDRHMSYSHRLLSALIPFICLCTHPMCLHRQTQSRETMVGYYLSEECKECAGFEVGGLIEELELNEDSTFVLSHLAVRRSFNDIVTITKMEGKWRMVNDELRLSPVRFEKTGVDSVYNPLPKKNIFVLNHKNADEMRVSFCRKSNGRCSSRCSELFTRQVNKPYPGMERH